MEEMRESQEIDRRSMDTEQVEEEEDGVDLEEDRLEISKKTKMSTGQEEDQMKRNVGLKHREVEDLGQEEEEEGEEQEDIAGIEKTAGRNTLNYLHLLRREAWLGQEATPNH